jgi:hypothetical protein
MCGMLAMFQQRAAKEYTTEIEYHASTRAGANTAEHLHARDFPLVQPI